MRLLVILVLAAAMASARGLEPEPLPAQRQALLLLRVLAYDRNLRGRAGNELTVVVAYREGDEGSERERDAIASALEDAARSFLVSGLRVRVRKLPWRGGAELGAQLRGEHASALYAGESLALEAAGLGIATRASSVLSFAPSRQMVQAGLAVGLVHRGDRAGVLVNLQGALAEGADLDSAFLAVVEVAGRRAPAER